jgi:NTP pyrophosphatase (non-canonical NTP hydrolase)
MNHLIQAVNEWAESRGIMDKATPRAQAKKTLEEAGELLEAVCDDAFDEIALELGDVMVTCIIGCALQGITPEEALQAAYDKISKRGGRMVDGQFVRDEENDA